MEYNLGVLKKEEVFFDLDATEASLGDMQIVKMHVFREAFIIGRKQVTDPLLELDYFGM